MNEHTSATRSSELVRLLRRLCTQPGADALADYLGPPGPSERASSRLRFVSPNLPGVEAVEARAWTERRFGVAEFELALPSRWHRDDLEGILTDFKRLPARLGPDEWIGTYDDPDLPARAIVVAAFDDDDAVVELSVRTESMAKYR